MRTFEEWRLKFETKNAESMRKQHMNVIDTMTENIDKRHRELSKIRPKGFSKIQKRMDTNINNVSVTRRVPSLCSWEPGIFVHPRLFVCKF